MSARQALCERDPVFAWRIGDLRQGGLLPSGRAANTAERIGELQRLPCTDEERPWIARAVALDTFAQMELGERRSAPDVASLWLEALWALLSAPFQAEAERFERVEQQLAGTGVFCVEAAATLAEVDPWCAAVERRRAKAAAALCLGLAEAARGRASAATAGRLGTLGAQASAELEAYATALAAAKTQPACVMDEAQLARAMALMGWPLDLHDNRELVAERLADARHHRDNAVRALTGFSDHRSALKQLAAQTVSGDVAAALIALQREARDWLGEAGALSLDDERCEVWRVPPSLDVQGLSLSVVAHRPGWPERRSIVWVGQAARQGVTAGKLLRTVATELYPGQHCATLAAGAWAVPWAATRRLDPVACGMAAWQHYAEALLIGSGFRRDAEHEVSNRQATFRVCLQAELALRLCKRTISAEAAAQQLVDGCAEAPDVAWAVVQELRLKPLLALAPVTGKLLLRRARTERLGAQAAQRGGAGLAAFHREVLGRGPLGAQV